MIFVNTKEYTTRKAVKLLARAHAEMSKALHEALHAFEGNDGEIVIDALTLDDGIVIDAITTAKINQAAADQLARIEQERAEQEAQQLATVEAIRAQQAAQEVALTARLAQIVQDVLIANGLVKVK